MDGFDTLVTQIISPPKAIYKLHSLGLENFYNSGTLVTRHDFNLQSRGFEMSCSYYYFPEDPKGTKRNCIIYCHAAGSCRTEALGIIQAATQAGYTLFFFDFPGNGLSEGDFISFGVREKEDIRVIIHWLHKLKTVDKIVLWGRSMGAVAAFIYAANHFDIDAIVADSPFSSLSKMILEIGKKKSFLPEFLISPFMFFLKSKIETKAKIKFEQLEVLQYMKKCITPILFITSKNDKLISTSHAETLYKQYTGLKELMYINFDHKEERGNAFYENIINKFINCLFCFLIYSCYYSSE